MHPTTSGVQIGGSLKNVMAIAVGICRGGGMGASAEAALITRGYAELVRLGVAMGARAETLMGLSGLGDLVLTCSSELSRNFSYGIAVGSGQRCVRSQAGRRRSYGLDRQRDRRKAQHLLPGHADGGPCAVRPDVGRGGARRLMSRPIKVEHPYPGFRSMTPCDVRAHPGSSARCMRRFFTFCGFNAGSAKRAGTNTGCCRKSEHFMVSSHSITPVILCGGAGSRLWPMSRDSKPKQFHKLVNDKTLLTNTLERVDHKGEGLRYLPTRIVGGIGFESLLVEQGETGSAEVERYILEPLIRDTAAAITAAIADLAENDPARMVLVLPSDHQISDVAAFYRCYTYWRRRPGPSAAAS
jgi:hypothetical protein